MLISHEVAVSGIKLIMHKFFNPLTQFADYCQIVIN